MNRINLELLIEILTNQNTMKRISLSLVLCAGLIFTSCKDEKKENELEDQSETEMSSEMETEKEEEIKKVKVTLNSVSNSNLSGNVVFTEENGEFSMTAIISGLAEGKHEINLNEN